MREEMGYPIMVTPVSQFVATQATMNVIGGERWRDVSDEMVRYFLGHFYEPAAPVDPQVAERVLSLPRAAELRDLEPLSLEGARERFGARISEEELLLRLTMPAEQVDAMVAARGEPAARRRPARARPARAAAARAGQARVALLRAGGEGRRPGRVAPCGLTTSAASSSTWTARSSTAAPTSAPGRCPGAVQVLEAIRASGRPLVLFTNGSHMAPGRLRPRAARGRAARVGRRAAHARVQRAHLPAPAGIPAQPAMVFGSDATRERMAAAGVPLVDDGVGQGRVRGARRRRRRSTRMERAARAVAAGAPLLTASYQPGFWGANGLIFSRGAMVTAAIAKVTQAEPIVVGKPSRAAVDEVIVRLGVPSADVAVIGDDLGWTSRWASSAGRGRSWSAAG